MIGRADDDEKATLLRYLDAQRDSVLAILDGLSDSALNTSVVGSGWTPLGLVRHLCAAERLWLHRVLAGSQTAPYPWPAEGGDPFTVELPTADVIAFYREQIALSNSNIAARELTDRPRLAPPPDLAEFAVDVRSIVLHMIEETARHAGHLDIVRELIDGRTGLGPR